MALGVWAGAVSGAKADRYLQVAKVRISSRPWVPSNSALSVSPLKVLGWGERGNCGELGGIATRGMKSVHSS